MYSETFIFSEETTLTEDVAPIWRTSLNFCVVDSLFIFLIRLFQHYYVLWVSSTISKGPIESLLYHLSLTSVINLTVDSQHLQSPQPSSLRPIMTQHQIYSNNCQTHDLTMRPTLITANPRSMIKFSNFISFISFLLCFFLMIFFFQLYSFSFKYFVYFFLIFCLKFFL